MKEKNQNLDVNLDDELSNDEALIKENTNNNNNNNTLNETDLLRKDSKNLLWSLKQHQNVIKQSFSKLINHEKDDIEEYDNVNSNLATISSNINNVNDENEQIEDQLDQENSDEENSRVNLKNRYSSNLWRSQDSLRFLDEVQPKKNKPKITKLKTNSAKKTKKPASAVSVKTVSFCDYLRTCDDDDDACSTGSRRRRSRSASPYLNKKPTKSILKKQIVQDELSEDNDEDEDEDVVDSMKQDNHLDAFNLSNQAALSSHSSESLSSNGSVSTNSLLNSDIYGGFNADFDEVLSNEPLSIQTKSNKTKFIDYISKKRQSFLNHNYYTECYDDPKLFIDNNNNNNSNNNSNSSTTKRHNADLNSKSTNLSRSFSADNCQLQKTSERSRQNASTNNKIPTKSVSKATSTNSFSTQNISIKQKSTATAATNENSTHKQRLNSSLKKEKIRNYKKLMNQMKKSKPLLGYDWALGNLIKQKLLVKLFLIYSLLQ